MIAFIESVIKLVIQLFFVDQLAKENEELKKENQRLKQENQELAKAKAEGIENHFSLFQKYLALNHRNEALTKQLYLYTSGKRFAQSKRSSIPTQKTEVNHQNRMPSNFDLIDRLLQEFSLSEEITI